MTFDGSGTQTLDTDAITFYHLTVNNGSTLLDAAEFTVDGTLTNNGTLQKTQVVTGTSDVSFFNTGGYGGLTLNANGTNLGSTEVNIRGNQDCTAAAGETVKRCFNITPATTTDRDATITFYFDSSEIPASQSCSNLNAYHWNGSSWASLNVSDRDCTSTPRSLTVTGVGSFSPFVLGESGPTAVTLASFTARLAGSMSGFVLPLALVVLGAVGGTLVVWARRRVIPRI